MSGHGITKILKLNDYSVIGCERIGHLEVSAAILKVVWDYFVIGCERVDHLELSGGIRKGVGFTVLFGNHFPSNEFDWQFCDMVNKRYMLR
ncbi:hypothetical protein CDAR_206381 [Caerostris darwini]|uniref:Uncharacterized protein n=1 Tax=Caerostris darwini TaxID=1538125 RepID=A0AAV4RJE7_9ARAC|nr:hypothetical protein CDAR_206381 [Caerostris darwini]